MLTVKDFPNDYDGFYFLPVEDETKEGLSFHFFKFKDEYCGGEPIEKSSVGDKFHIAMFKRGEDGTPELDDAFEAIFADPVVYVQGLQGAEIYDYSGMVSLKKVYDRFADLGKVVALSSISLTSRRLMEKTAYMWQGVNFLEVEEGDQQTIDQSTNMKN